MMASSIKDIDTKTPNLDYLYNLFDGYRSAIVLTVACELELFDVLERSSEPPTACDLATAQGWNEDNTERLLKSLAALKVVDVSQNPKGQDVYRVAAAGEHLIRNKVGSSWGFFAGFVRKMGMSLTNLATEIKTGSKKKVSHPHQVTVHKQAEQKGAAPAEGAGADHGKGHVGASLSMLDRYKAMDGTLRACAPTMVTAFDLSQYKSAVDLGGGSGAAAYALARAYPNMAVTVFEVPPVIKLIQEHFLSEEKDISVSLSPGDFFETDLPGSELYLLSKVVHDWNETQVDTLLQRVHGAVKPGGAVLLFEKCLNNGGVGPVSANMFDLTVMSFCAGNQRSFQQYQAVLEKNGFNQVQFARTQNDCIYDVIYAKKC